MSQKSLNTDIYINNNVLFYACTHMKMSTPFYATQLCDMFAYEVVSPVMPETSNADKSNTMWSKSQSTVVVYNFHSLYSQDRFFFFVQTPTTGGLKSSYLPNTSSSDSIAELFPAANWLEREVSELHGVPFTGKKDLRNLLLQYGDTTAPFQKLFPSIGVKELFYDPLKDTLVQKTVSVQI